MKIRAPSSEIAMAEVFACPICATFEAPSLSYLLSHLRLVHANDPRFNVTCGLDGCAYTARSFSALYSHIYRRHKSCGAIQSKKRERSVLMLNSPLTNDGVDHTNLEMESFQADSYGKIIIIP